MPPVACKVIVKAAARAMTGATRDARDPNVSTERVARGREVMARLLSR